jgi:hypothetical protein
MLARYGAMTLILGQDEKRLGSTVETTFAPEEPAAQEIVVTATSCKEPVLLGAWRRPGAYANAIGSTFLFESEVDQDVVRRANFVCIHPCKELSTETEDPLRDIEIGLVAGERLRVVAGSCRSGARLPRFGGHYAPPEPAYGSGGYGWCPTGLQ